MIDSLRIVLSFLAITLSATAGEYAVLANGFRIHADSHVIDGNIVRLETSQGAIEMDASLVARFEAEDYVPPVPLVPPSKPADEGQDLLKATAQELVTRAAVDAGLPPAIVQSIAKAESGYRTDAISRKGAIGLMQLMPATAADLNANPYDPLENAGAGARYLRQLLLRYQSDPHQVSKAIAAYNAGPAAVDKYDGIPPYRETIDYVTRVLKEYESEQRKKTPGAE